MSVLWVIAEMVVEVKDPLKQGLKRDRIIFTTGEEVS